jgi:hypothetical protein
MSIRG